MIWSLTSQKTCPPPSPPPLSHDASLARAGHCRSLYSASISTCPIRVLVTPNSFANVSSVAPGSSRTLFRCRFLRRNGVLRCVRRLGRRVPSRCRPASRPLLGRSVDAPLLDRAFCEPDAQRFGQCCVEFADVRGILAGELLSRVEEFFVCGCDHADDLHLLFGFRLDSRVECLEVRCVRCRVHAIHRRRNLARPCATERALSA